MRAFLIGLQFLTRIMVVKQDNWTVEDFGRSVKYFPLIGAVLGTIYGACSYLLFTLLPSIDIKVPYHISTVIFVLLPIIMTGGLHADGFMDTMDGVFSGRSRERMLEIMKDSHVGANGVFAFVLLMLGEWAVILDLPKDLFIETFFIMPIIARLMMTMTIRLYPYARKEGIGKAFAVYSENYSLPVAIFLTCIFILPLGFFAIFALIVSTIFTFIMLRQITKLLGGVTGDVYGAVTTLNEFIVLCAGLFYPLFFDL